MEGKDYILIVAGMGLVTYIPRLLPFLLLSGKALPEKAKRFLTLLPPAILSAILVPALLVSEDHQAIEVCRIEFFAAIPTFAVAIITRSLGGTVAFGMLLYWAMDRLWG